MLESIEFNISIITKLFTILNEDGLLQLNKSM